MPTGTYKHKINQGFQKGHKLSKESLKKRGLAISKAKIGHKLSEATKLKIGKENKGKLKGNKHPNWKGKGCITPENERIRKNVEYRLWRESVFARDNWICQKCEQRGEKLHAHHIFNFATYLDLRLAIDNGITFCRECHREFHKKYGIKNNTKEQLEEFLL